MQGPTPKERVMAALAYEETDIVPYDIIIEPEVEDRLNEHYGGDEWAKVIQKHIAIVSFPYFSKMEFVDDNLVRDDYGCVWDPHARPIHLVGSPLEEPTLEGYDFDSVRKTILDAFDDATAVSIIIENRHAFLVGQYGSGLFETSWKFRGFENALVDSVLHPDFYEELLDRITDLQLALIDRLCELPIDCVQVQDDWSEQRGVILGPDRWRQLIKPRAKKLFDRIRDAGKVAALHCCGNNFEVIPDMIEMGLDVLESLQPEAMDVYEIKRRYGNELRLWGGLGTQHVLPFGTPDEVRGEIRRLIAKLGRGGGYILAPAKPLMADVPTANAVTVIEEFAQGR